MKLFDNAQVPHGPEGAQKRPFRKLKAAGIVLAATIFSGLAAAGIMQLNHLQKAREAAVESRRCESCRREVDSVSLGRIAAYLEAILNRKDGHNGRDSLVHKALEEYSTNGSYKWYPRPEARWPWELAYLGNHDYWPEDGWPWDCRGSRYVGSPEGEDLGNGRRAKDSVMLRRIIGDAAAFGSIAAETKAAIMSRDSAELIKAVEYAKTPDHHLDAVRWRGAFIHSILNTADLMLPEERKRQDDSLLLRPIIASRVERTNQRIVDALERHESTERYRFWKDKRGRTHEHNDGYCSEKRYENALKEYEKAKLPDGHSRRQDSIELIRRFVELGHEHDAAYEEYLYEKGPHVSPGSPPPTPGPSQPMPHWAGRE